MDPEHRDSGPMDGSRPGIGLASRHAIVMMAASALVSVAGCHLALKYGLLRLDSPELALVQAMAAINVVLAGLVAWMLGRRTARRLGALRQAIERISDADYREQLGPGTDDEIGQLAHALNSLGVLASARERRLMESALSDPLTGLPNRALLTDRIRHMIKVSHRARSSFAVALLDLDRFKQVNDTLGHACGDLLLSEVARRLRTTVRESDTVARLGGDEFVLLMPGNVDAAREVCRRVLVAMREPLHYNDERIDIDASIGIAVFPEHGQDDVSLMRHADLAMYQAKRTHSGERVFDGETAELNRSHLSLLGEMRTALERGQFELDYQPRLDLQTGLVIGLEGLVRWNHPVRGRVPPGEFIPFAEESGFMREITHWVVACGARFSRELREAGIDLVVAVNVSALDIENPGFGGEVIALMGEAGVDPRHMCLEITESGLLSESSAALDNLYRLSKSGLELAVDDFGTGYATLRQLQQLPVNVLKIDRSFVNELHRKRNNLTIVRSTIELGKRLGLKVVAEGVETLEELRTLAELGCDEVQGYYLSRPMRSSDVRGWIEQQHAARAATAESRSRLLTEPH